MAQPDCSAATLALPLAWPLVGAGPRAQPDCPSGVPSTIASPTPEAYSWREAVSRLEARSRLEAV